MDNNNTPAPNPAEPVMPTIAQPSPVEGPKEPVQPLQAPASAVSRQAPSSGNKTVLLFIIGLVVVIAIAAGVYFMLARQQEKKAAVKEQVAVETPMPTSEPDLESGLNQINIDSGEEDFTAVDTDLQGL